jgi:hypothetical protein
MNLMIKAIKYSQKQLKTMPKNPKIARGGPYG